MHRYHALALACLLILSACGGEPDLPGREPPNSAEDEPLTILEQDGLFFALPAQYTDQLTITDEPAFPSYAGERFVLSVSETASIEAAGASGSDGCGYLFGFAVVDRAGMEQLLCLDYPGIEIFATDGELYYAYTHPTDVRFYRLHEGSLLDHPDWPVWEELAEIGPAVREDFLTRNGLTPYNGGQLLDQPYTYTGEHICLEFYNPPSGENRTLSGVLVLSQPATQGPGGIWAVERWLDEDGNVCLYFPDTGKPAAEYYANLQEFCGGGERPELLTPVGAAQDFIKDYYGFDAPTEAFQPCTGDTAAFAEANLRFRGLALDVMRGQDVEPMELLNCVGHVTGQNLGFLGPFLYGSEWWPSLEAALRAASVGPDQAVRTRNMMAFFLTLKSGWKNAQASISAILETQRSADPEAFAAALEEFSEEDQAYIRENAAG
ncbi:hypothetical protein AALC17_03785 [Oscillospiraceae bacterium 38-13]